MRIATVGVLALLVLRLSDASAQRIADIRVGLDNRVSLNHSTELARLSRDDAGDTYWKEGALILGVPTAIGYWLFARGMSGEEGNSILNGLFVGAVAAGVGGLIGWFFPKREANHRTGATLP